MIKDELQTLILRNFPHHPTSEQAEVVEKWVDFLLTPRCDELFLLTGYAGTGKTSLVGALVKSLRLLHRTVVLLAPTGRAAKVFSHYAQTPAYTIHRKIYRQKSFSPEMVGFEQTPNQLRGALFIVDEASMIGGEGTTGSMFGTGRLLDDLVHHVYAGPGCRLMLIGDAAQLPPVGEELSPALNPQELEVYGLTVRSHALTQVVRQVKDSGILWNATSLRDLIRKQFTHALPRLRLMADVTLVPGNELIDALEQSYSRCGTEDTIVVTRSNRRAIVYNNGIRARILDREELLEGGDQLIVVRNNYYWTSTHEAGPSTAKPTPEESASDTSQETDGIDFLANGDMALVRRIRNERSFYGFRFADATLRLPDYDDLELDVTLLMDTLQAEAPALTQEQQQKLFHAVCADYPELKNRRDLLQRVKQDPYYNALQVKYAYAVTCHKAQGGQWRHVYIDQGYLTPEMLTPDYFRWLYTALTRATEHVFLVNWPKDQAF